MDITLLYGMTESTLLGLDTFSSVSAAGCASSEQAQYIHINTRVTLGLFVVWKYILIYSSRVIYRIITSNIRSSWNFFAAFYAVSDYFLIATER